MTRGAGQRGAAASAPEMTVRVSRSYRSTPKAAFDAWTNPVSLEQWFGPPGFRAEVLVHELRVGGAWRFRMIADDGSGYHHFGTFLEISPPRRLAFTWASEEQVEGWRDAGGNPTTVTVDFEEGDAGVTVVITHRDLASEETRRSLTHGWDGSLVCLADSLERPESAG